ncbi:shikimate kinase [Luteimonas sp. 8-5]|uniref:shikimate kinase n=1 Tax=Luteimonas sp. 8-5 TaxID=3039387 RepID=UPI00243680AE|nr:shikimate kinase [Luteimonas sp. 8-5]MDG6347716.1 shikimate kinase [Luteimonas sp. 8-5]
MKTAPNLVLVGPMGAGKTVVGSRLAGRLGLAFIDLDATIADAAGKSVPELFATRGEAAFRELERSALAGALANRDQLIATGGGAVLDAGSRELMRRHGFVAWLQVDVEGQLRRLADTDDRPLLQVADRGERMRRLAALRDPLYAEVADLTLETGDDPPGQVVATLERLLPLHWKHGETAA